MKYTLRLLLPILFFVAHSVYGQNKITLHLTDTVITLYGVDSVYYGYNEDSDYVQTVVTFDSTYSFVVDDIDSMKYQGPRIVANGVVHGGDTSMMVVSLTDIQHLTDTAFSLMAYSGWHSQLIAATNSDTMPVMLYRGHVREGQTLVIDTLSTVEALVGIYLPLGVLADTDYATFDSMLHSADSFSSLYQLVGQSIAARRPIVDSANQRLFDALSSVIGQMAGLDDSISGSDAKSTFFMGSHTMRIETIGSQVNLSMWDLNPTYIGTVSDAFGHVIVNNLRVPSRADYGIMDIFWNRTLYGESSTFDMTRGGSGSKIFELSCRSLPAQIDFYLSAFVLPAISLCGDILGFNGNCIRGAAIAIAESMATSYIDGVLHSGSAHPFVNADVWLGEAREFVIESIRACFDASYVPVLGHFMPDQSYVDCIPSIRLSVLGGLLNIFDRVYTVEKVMVNTSGRCHYYFHQAPENISFCLEHYGSGTAHQCSEPGLMCYSGNGQQGYPDSLLPEPIVLKINSLDDDGERVERHFHLHLRVTSGGGSLTDTIFDVMTSYIYDVQRQTTWRLGSDTTLPQRVTAWLTDPTINNTVVGSPVTISAFFHQAETRIDSFRVAADRYVCFSKGNLQYQPSSATWRFAEHQYDTIGHDNLNISNNDTSYTGWIDLFSWATADNPTFVPINNSSYDAMSTISFVDWGVHPISNGGAQMNMWRTPTFAEWNYVINRRTNHDSLYTYATVCGVHGMILLPDNWVLPDSVTFAAQQHNWTSNVYDSTAWSRMEGAGAIFLPAAGNRMLSNTTSSLVIHNVGNAGHYWSASGHLYYPTYSYTPSQHAYRMGFFGTTGNPPQGYLSVECYWGLSVRLIRNL